MGAQFTVAATTAVASVLAAAFAWSQAVRASKLKAETDLAIERMKADRELRQRAFEIAGKETEPVMSALKTAWSDIQTVKDVIRKVLAPAHHDLVVALDTLHPAAGSLADGYRQWGAIIPADVRAAWHAAKSTALTLEAELQDRTATGDGYTPPAELSGDILDVFQEARLALTDYQMTIALVTQSLRDSHAQKLLAQL